jgi:hypothetical protein
MNRSTLKSAAKIGGRVFVAAVVIVGACKPAPPPMQCLQFSADLMPDLAGGLIRKDFRVANAWAVKSDQTIDSSGVKVPAYYLSADIIAPSGEAVVGTWLTTDVSKPGLIYSLSPQAKKYSNWLPAASPATAGITMEGAGAKESVTCVLNGRARSPQPGVAPATVP